MNRQLSNGIMLSVPRFLNMRWIPKLLVSMFALHATLQLNDVNGVAHTPLQLHNRTAAVLIFVGVDCPISNSYAPEIKKIIKDYARRDLDFYIVYSDPMLAVTDAKKHAADYGFPCPALLDPHQLLMKKVHATVTPEAAVVDAQGKVQYLGRINNWYQDFGKQRYSATTHELRDALDEILAGEKVKTPVTKAVGCPI